MPATTYSPTLVYRGRPRPRKASRGRFLRGRFRALEIVTFLVCLCHRPIRTFGADWRKSNSKSKAAGGGARSTHSHIHFGHSYDSGIVEGEIRVLAAAAALSEGRWGGVCHVLLQLRSSAGAGPGHRAAALSA